MGAPAPWPAAPPCMCCRKPTTLVIVARVSCCESLVSLSADCRALTSWSISDCWWLRRMISFSTAPAVCWGPASCPPFVGAWLGRVAPAPAAPAAGMPLTVAGWPGGANARLSGMCCASVMTGTCSSSSASAPPLDRARPEVPRLRWMRASSPWWPRRKWSCPKAHLCVSTFRNPYVFSWRMKLEKLLCLKFWGSTWLANASGLCTTKQSPAAFHEMMGSVSGSSTSA
mmetsp:Transcript_10663/g.31736  ORF Transcript_10663/g.31736 Transcript_10663/m.31736 type:complete len:228 (-) Transcript_10663:132-815(-)